MKREKLLQAYAQMSNRHAHNHSFDKSYRLGKHSPRLHNSSLEQGMQRRLASAVENLDMPDDRRKERQIRRGYEKLVKKKEK